MRVTTGEHFQGEKRKLKKIKDQKVLINKTLLLCLRQLLHRHSSLPMPDIVSIVAISKLHAFQRPGAQINAFT